MHIHLGGFFGMKKFENHYITVYSMGVQCRFIYAMALEITVVRLFFYFLFHLKE